METPSVQSEPTIELTDVFITIFCTFDVRSDWVKDIGKRNGVVVAIYKPQHAYGNGAPRVTLH